MIHAGILIKDSSVSRVICYPIASEHRPAFSVWLLPLTYDKSLFFEHFLSFFVLPRLKDIRMFLSSLKSEELRLPLSDAVESSSSLNERWRSVRAALTFDGASPQVKAFSSENFDSPLVKLCKDQKVKVIKWAAAASLLEQPADIGAMHAPAHRYFSSSKFDYTDVGNPSTAMKLFLDTSFENSSLPAASKKVFAVFLAHIEVAMNKAFTISAILNAWRIPGYIPYSVDQIFSGFTGWTDIPKDEADIIVRYIIIDLVLLLFMKLCSSIPHFAEYVGLHGRLPDSIMWDYLTSKGKMIFLRGDDDYDNATGLDVERFKIRPSSSKPLEDMPLNFQRVLWLNNDGFMATERERNLQRDRDASFSEERKWIREQQKEHNDNVREESRWIREEVPSLLYNLYFLIWSHKFSVNTAKRD